MGSSVEVLISRTRVGSRMKLLSLIPSDAMWLERWGKEGGAQCHDSSTRRVNGDLGRSLGSGRCVGSTCGARSSTRSELAFSPNRGVRPGWGPGREAPAGFGAEPRRKFYTSRHKKACEKTYI